MNNILRYTFSCFEKKRIRIVFLSQDYSEIQIENVCEISLRFPIDNKKKQKELGRVSGKKTNIIFDLMKRSFFKTFFITRCRIRKSACAWVYDRKPPMELFQNQKLKNNAIA